MVAQLTTTQADYLQLVDIAIDIAARLERDRESLALHDPAQVLDYQRVTAAGWGMRRNERLFHFELAAPAPSAFGAQLLRVRGAPQLRGQVRALRGNLLTLALSPVDGAPAPAPPAQGTLEPAPSLATFGVQHRAVAELRRGTARNPHLARLLVERQFTPYSAAAFSTTDLDDDQAAALCAALAVPDMLLVLGPPGTGKTHTITHIAREYARRHQKVLLTAKTNRAVDNALERLSRTPDLRLLRVGSELRMTPDSLALTLDAQAQVAQANALAQPAPDLTVVTIALDRLVTLIPEYASAEVQVVVAHKAHAGVWDRVAQSFAKRVQRLEETRTKLSARAVATAAQAESAGTLLTQLQTRSRQRFSGAFLALPVWRAGRNVARLARRQTKLQSQITAVAAQIEHERTALNVQWQKAGGERYDDTLATVQATQQQLMREGVSAAQAIAAALTRLAIKPDPADLPTEFAQLDSAALGRVLEWGRRTIGIAQQRATIVREWQAELAKNPAMLAPALVRSADVIAATCIGAATAPELLESEFELAIVDEAGQIALPDLLVPLVRARRAVLVGDYQQLPPFAPSEVEGWLAALSPEAQQDVGLVEDLAAVTNLLTKSTFEMLFPVAAASHRIYLLEQRRMPAIIATFISNQFYGGKLQTAATAPAPVVSTPFRSPIVFIDTADLPRRQRGETQRGNETGDPEGFGKQGYFNKAEAEVVADLTAVYAAQDADWVVITPYQAQAERIRQQLRPRVPATINLGERVATIDSFQGGERDVVMFSFTRSNGQGAIGFLRELRRLNVTMSRAKRQLVLVGDSTTLCQAKDDGFRALAGALIDYIKTAGDYVPAAELAQRLGGNA